MHNKTLRRVKLTANSIPAGDVILLQSVLLCPFFGLANFAGLFSFQLLTFVCRTSFLDYTFILSHSDVIVHKKCSAALYFSLHSSAMKELHNNIKIGKKETKDIISSIEKICALIESGEITIS